MSVDSPLVSIIVPIYGVEKYLDTCITSIVNQTYKHLEILLIDDGSQDSCPQICDSWARRDERIRVFHKHNGGLSDARNYGIDRARGDYIYCVDSDDWIATSLVEKCINMCLQHNADITLFEYSSSNEAGDTVRLSKDAEKFPPQGLYPASEVLKFLWEDKLQNFAWAFVAKREIYAADIRFPVNRLMEDMGTTYRLWSRAKNIYLLRDPLYNYRVRGNSILGKKGAQMCYDTVQHICAVDAFAATQYPQLLQNELDWSVRYLSSCLIWAYESKTNFSEDEYKRFVSEVTALIKTRIHKIGFHHLSNSNKLKVLGLLLHITPAVVWVSQRRDARRR